MLSALALPSTPMEFVKRLTVQDVTPGTLETAFSTRALQAAQLMPFTLNCSILRLPPFAVFLSMVSRILYPIISFHQLLQGRHELVDDLVMSLADVARHTGPDMAGGLNAFIAALTAADCISTSLQYASFSSML